MTRTLPGADIRGYYDALGIELPAWAQQEASVRCFADPDTHNRGDRDPSCSINLEHGAWHCHGCGARGGAYDAATALGHTPRGAMYLMISYGLAERRRSSTTIHRARAPHAEARPHGKPLPSRGCRGIRVSETDIRHWQTALTDQPELIGRLARERGWLYSTMHELGLGYDCGRITIPVRDEHRHLVGLLRYRPWPKPGQPKMMAAAGSRRVLLPHPAAEPSRELLLVEGEPDMIAARSRGLPAIALPGVDSWRPEWAALFGGRQVTIVMDCDVEGRRAADRIANDLRAHASSDALVVEIADHDDGYDLTDWFLDGQRSVSASRYETVDTLVTHVRPETAPTPPTDTQGHDCR
jgi:hypothetical protein